jgi:hypothetical protein
MDSLLGFIQITVPPVFFLIPSRPIRRTVIWRLLAATFAGVTQLKRYIRLFAVLDGAPPYKIFRATALV